MFLSVHTSVSSGILTRALGLVFFFGSAVCSRGISIGFGFGQFADKRGDGGWRELQLKDSVNVIHFRAQWQDKPSLALVSSFDTLGLRGIVHGV